MRPARESGTVAVPAVQASQSRMALSRGLSLTAKQCAYF